MTTPEKQNLERMLSAHLQKSLNPQRGKAKLAFQKFTQTTPPKQLMNTPKNLWRWAALPSALAAALALSISLLALHNAGTPNYLPQSPIAKTTPIAAPPPILDQETITQNLDPTTGILADDTPIQILRQQSLRRTQWVDPNDRATYSITEPIEKVGYVRIQPY